MSPSDLRHALGELASDADPHHPADRVASVHRRARRTARTRAVAGATAAVVVVLGGTWAVHAAWSPEAVGPGSPTTTNHPTNQPMKTPPAPTPTPTPAPVKTPTQSTSSPATTDRACSPSSLAVRLGAEEGTAGSMYVPVVLTNTGSMGCWLKGYPDVALAATSGGPAVGPQSTHDPGYPATPVRLAPGRQASALVRIVDAANVPPSMCGAEPASFLRVAFPGVTATTDLALPSPTQACSKSFAQLFVRPVVAGTTGL